MRLILNQTHWIEAYPDAEARFGELVEAAERFLGRSVSSEPKTESVPPAASGSVASEPASALPKTYKVGDYYHENGKEGIVFEVDAAGASRQDHGPARFAGPTGVVYKRGMDGSSAEDWGYR